MPDAKRITHCLGLFALLVTPALAQEGQMLEYVHPQGGQVGTTVEVIACGNFLQQPEEVIFYQPGIRCTKLQTLDQAVDARSGQSRAIQPGTAVKLTLDVSQDAEPGEYQLRLRTRDNLSELVTFWVTPFPLIMEQHAWYDVDGSRNDSAETAQSIPVGCTVAGYLPASLPQDHDWFRVQCSKGERLSVEVIAARLGTLHYGGMNDPAVRILDSEGNELGRNDDNALHTQDPVLSVVIPRDGTYFINMRQQMDYEAGRMRHYLMHVGSFPRPLLAYPLGGQAGKTVPVQLLGDPTGVLRTNVALPSNPGVFESMFVDVFPRSSGKIGSAAPSPNRLHTARFPDVFESAGQTTQKAPQVVSRPLPVAIHGRIESEGEVDWYRVSAKKGERYRVFAYAKSLDSELDARVWMLPAPGNSSSRRHDEDDSRWEPHDLVGHHYRHQTKIRLDPVFMFEPDTDGDWLIGIGDTRREFGPHHVYRIEFQPHVDRQFVHFPAYPANPTIVRDRIVLFPGHSYSRPVMVQPGFGSRYDGLLQLHAKNLPAGVAMQCRPFKQNAGVIPVEFHAGEDANVGASLIDLVVRPVDPADRDHFRGGFVQNNQATNRRGDFAMYFNRTRKMALAVVQGAKFDLRIDPPSVPLVRGGDIRLTVSVDRHPGFEGDVYCEMDWLPAGVNKQPPLIIPAGESKAQYRLSAGGSAAAGEYPISITGREKDGGNVRTAAGFHYVCSPAVTLAVGEPYLAVELVRAAIQRGGVGQIVGRVRHHRPFQGVAALRLARLPFGVQQVEPFPTIKSGETSVKFQVKVTDDCLVGQYKDIYCEVTVNDGDQEIHQQTGDGVLRVDPRRGQ